MPPKPPPVPPTKPAIDFDPEEYARYLADLDLTPEQRDELIRAVANIMLAFVDLGFGIAPGQGPCGQGGILSDLFPKLPTDLLYCEHSNTPETLALAASFASAEQEDS